MNIKPTLLFGVLLAGFLAGGIAGAAECCTAPDNGAGTVDWPWPGCTWRSYETGLVFRSDDDRAHVRADFAVDSFFDVFIEDGGSLGGQIARFKADLTLQMSGSGELDGFARLISLPVSVEVHSSPHTGGDRQSWDTEIVSMSLRSEYVGDPDFDLLRVRAGWDFGMPSPGHTTLTRLGPPGSDFAVDSFFDITYEIEFAGAPGSYLEGLSGRTFGTIRMGNCPPLPATVQKVVKFRQAPLDGEGANWPYFGHDELSTAYSWYDFRGGGTGNQIKGYKGCFVADDFADKFDKPVVYVRWWGSYLDNLIAQPVRRFLIVFEEDVPADPVTGFSHPGKVLSSEVVYLNPSADPESVPAGQYVEQPVGDGGAPCHERLYVYTAALRKPFEQRPDTVYWLKIVALVDLPPQVAGELEGCLDNTAGGSLCEFLHLPREQQQQICPNLVPITRWGWHNRDYRVFNPLASGAVAPGENNQQDMFGFLFPTEVWHFQDDAVSGDVFLDETKPLDPDLCPDCPLVQQARFKPENYVYDRLCQQGGVVMGVDGPKGIELYSKDLAFVLFAIEQKPEEDCNKNGVPDHIDIANGTSDDCNGNGIPDECENDCNCNGIPDDQDIANGTSKDCNGNGIPDECEDDCNGNGIPDDCDIAAGTSKDCNGNGVPDECEDDCNGNGTPDDCDIANGTSEDKNNNGIPDECEPPCKQPRTFRCVAGRIDNFNTTDGSEPTDPSLYLLNNPGYCYNGAFTQFDRIPSNACFVHTFDNCCWPANWQVVAAKLEFCLKGGTVIPWTDSLHLKQNGTNLWGIKLNDLISWKTGGADAFWDRGQSECFELDLADLPPSGTDILSDLQAGFLDFVVADDTAVDYVILTVTVCPCPAQTANEYPAGIPDDFTKPTEPAVPGPELQTFCSPSRNFDDMRIDRCFGHTFAGLSASLLSAQLEIRLRAGKNPATCNDTIALQATTLGPPAFAWSRRIGTAGSYSWCAGPPGLLPTPWTAGSDHTFTLDLSALPNADGSTTCLLPQLIQDGRLDVRVADDTAVDYMILRTTTCCRRIIRKLGPADINNDLKVDFLDLGEFGIRWLDTAIPPDVADPTDPPPGN